MAKRSSIVRTWGFPVIVLALLGALLVAFYLNKDQNPDWLNYLEVGTSIILSTALVVIYFVQNRILDQQTNILKGRHTPLVGLENISIQQDEDGEFEGSTCVQFDAINSGNDIAQNMKLNCFIAPDRFRFKAAARASYYLSKIPILKVFVNTPHVLSKSIQLDSDDLPTDVPHSDGLVLPPNMDETVAVFAPIIFDYPHPGEPSPLLDTIDLYANSGFSTLYLGLVLTYENAFGSDYVRTIKSIVISPIQVGMDLDDVNSNSREYPIQNIRPSSGYEILKKLD